MNGEGRMGEGVSEERGDPRGDPGSDLGGGHSRPLPADEKLGVGAPATRGPGVVAGSGRWPETTRVRWRGKIWTAAITRRSHG